MSKFWMENVSILFDKGSIFKIIPEKDDDINTKLNTIFRFSIYYSMLSYVIYKNNSIFCFPFIVMLITIYIYKTNGGGGDEDYEDISITTETEIDHTNCSLPGKNNPFMNLNMFDINKDKKAACLSYNDDDLKEKIDDIFNDNLILDNTDIYSKNNSQNRYYTMPNTQSANKQSELANWLYKTPTTCKEGNGIQCANNLYNRLNLNSDIGIPSA